MSAILSTHHSYCFVDLSQPMTITAPKAAAGARVPAPAGDASPSLSDAVGHLPPTYVADAYRYQRRPTRVVYVGSVGVGGDNPIRVQSMTTSFTMDTAAT